MKKNQFPSVAVMFGAGASFGSLNTTNPPLGRDLYKALLEYNYSLWINYKDLFINNNFEEGMNLLIKHKDILDLQYLNADLGRFFMQFIPGDDNLYYKLASKIKEMSDWNGSFIILNYDILLQRALSKASVKWYIGNIIDPKFYKKWSRYTPWLETIQDWRVIGNKKFKEFYNEEISKYHIKISDSKDVWDDNDVEVIVPHGSAGIHASYSISDLENLRREVDAPIVGIGAFRNYDIEPHYVDEQSPDKNYMPVMAYYAKDKKSNFGYGDILFPQLVRYIDVITNCDKIIIVGIYPSIASDHHLWMPLSQTNAQIYYFSKDMYELRLIQAWADYFNVNCNLEWHYFEDGFNKIYDLMFSD